MNVTLPVPVCAPLFEAFLARRRMNPPSAKVVPELMVKLPWTVSAAGTASVIVPLVLTLRLLNKNDGIICAPEPLKFSVLPVIVCPDAVPGVKVDATPTVPVDDKVFVKLLNVK